METQLEKPALTQTRVFKDDTTEIARLGEILEGRDKAKFNSEHVLHRALSALRRELSQQTEPAA